MSTGNSVQPRKLATILPVPESPGTSLLLLRSPRPRSSRLGLCVGQALQPRIDMTHAERPEYEECRARGCRRL